ncbi:hypothetical protein [Taibaiella soli]|uniref:Uncharacterized protein n=1 Tax=Taibaiella soli TaxID=1649169 RepID=A0A2W2ARC5_9BACT|nr:hypothetical protein [Taibaiella soli]PZF75020.1 hypothetical protein DN068_00250 [Taibaiella soli]
MRKVLLGAAALSVMFATSCKKNDDKSGPSGTSTYTLAGTTYNPSSTVRGTGGNLGSLTGLDQSGNSFSTTFQTMPTANGTYKIVTVAPTAADEVAILATAVSGTGMAAYTSLATSAATATVTVNGGKVTVVVPEISAMRSVNTVQDTVKISGTLVEN